jgi:FxsC-like protein
MYHFVLSYARGIGVRAVKRFFDQLCDRLCRTYPELGKTPGFMDQDIRVGDSWPDELARHFHNCPILVPLYSPEYFASPDCGKELAIFLSRLANHPRGEPKPKPILPVVWIRKNLSIPPFLSNVQYDQSGFPREYLESDLDRLIRYDQPVAVEKFVDEFADRIAVSLAAGTPHLAAAPPTDYASIESAWSKAGRQAARAPSVPGKTVQVMFLVAKADELEQLRSPEAVSRCYGDDPRDWRAFLPPDDRDVGVIAAEIVTNERFHYEYLTFSDDFEQKVAEAESKRKIVILIVDPWIVHLPRYSSRLAAFDKSNYRYSAILVPLNDNDAENNKGREDLIRVLNETFYNRARFDPREMVYRAPLASYTEFDDSLRKVLAKIRSDILNASGRQRAIGPPGF